MTSAALWSTPRWRRSRALAVWRDVLLRPWLILSIGLLVAITGSTLARLDHGNWAWRAGGRTTTVANGVPVEWEWVDVAQGAWFAQADPRWPNRGQGVLLSQNASRFLPGLVVSWLAIWTGSALDAAVIASWLCWLTAALALFALCRLLFADAAQGRRIGWIAAALVALSPAFAAFTGDIDAHPFGYAAAPIGLLLMEWIWCRSHQTDDVAAQTRLAIGLGLVIFLCAATLELGPPLLVMLWGYYLGLRERQPGRGWLRGILGRVRPVVVATATYGALQASWWLIVHVAANGLVNTYNEGLAMTLQTLQRAPFPASVFERVQSGLAQTAVLTFTAPVAILLVVGVFILPRRVRWWVLVWVVAVLAGAALTRAYPRTIYLAFPAVYVGAATAIDWLGSLAVAATRRLAMHLRGDRFAPSTAGALDEVARWVPCVAILGVVGRIVLGDLSGDLSLLHFWWSG